MYKVFWKYDNALSSIQGLFLSLLLLFALEDVIAQHRRATNSRTRTVTNRPPPGPTGPNMCKVQQVVGTNEKFFTNCLAKHLQYICERPTFVRWQCCPGFFKKGREKGCTGEQPLDNLFNTSLRLDLIDFRTLTSRTSMAEELSTNGAYTVFVPSNEAITGASWAINQQLRQKDGKLIKYHTVPGRLNMTSFRGRNIQYVTLDNGNTLRVHKYPYGVSTVNCARVIRPDALATNGIMHVIDKVLHPADLNVSVAERISSDRRFTVFKRALNISGLFRRLKRKRGSFTVLAPTDRAFGRIPRETKHRILTDPMTAQKVLKRHIVKGVYCADAIVVSIGLRTLEKSRLLFRCKRDGMYVNEAKLVDKDIVGKNGVLHAINTVLMPDSVKSLGELLDDMHLNRFHKLIRESGLDIARDCANITVFSPTNYALGKLPAGYISSLRQDKEKLQKLLNYHVVPGSIFHNSLVGDSTLKTKANTDVRIKVNVYRDGIKLDQARLRSRPRICEGAVIHKVDKVLIPHEESFLDMLMRDRGMRTFARLLEKSLQTWSLDPLRSYTLLAPDDRAFGFLDPKNLRQITDNPTRLRRFVQRHFINRMVMRSTISTRGSYGIKSMQGDTSEFSYNNRRSLVVNTHSRVVSSDKMASNGIFLKIDHVLPCTCEHNLRTVRGQYINSARYRRIF